MLKGRRGAGQQAQSHIRENDNGQQRGGDLQRAPHQTGGGVRDGRRHGLELEGSRRVGGHPPRQPVQHHQMPVAGEQQRDSQHLVQPTHHRGLHE